MGKPTVKENFIKKKKNLHLSLHFGKTLELLHRKNNHQKLRAFLVAILAILVKMVRLLGVIFQDFHQIGSPK
jgi:hypothetical protein